MKIYFLSFMLFSAVQCFAQTDTTTILEEEYEFDTIVVEEEPVIVHTGKYALFTDKYSKYYISAFISISYDFGRIKANEGYEEYLKELNSLHVIDFSRDLGIGLYYLPKESSTHFLNANLLYSRYHQRYIFHNKSYTGRRTNIYQYVGADIKVGNWYKRTSNKLSLMISGGYRFEFMFRRLEETLNPNDTDYTIGNPLINRYRFFTHYLNVSSTVVIRIKRFKLGIEPYFMASIQNISRPNQTFDHRIFKTGIKSSFIFSY